MRQIQTSSNSIYPEFMEKQYNSGAVLISAMFGTRKYVDNRIVFCNKTF